MTKTQLLLIVSIGILCSACTSSEIPVSPKSPMFIQGQSDGCTTANGSYTKNSENFRHNKEYEDGWYAGRKNCNPINAKK